MTPAPPLSDADLARLRHAAEAIAVGPCDNFSGPTAEIWAVLNALPALLARLDAAERRVARLVYEAAWGKVVNGQSRPGATSSAPAPPRSPPAPTPPR